MSPRIIAFIFSRNAEVGACRLPCRNYNFLIFLSLLIVNVIFTTRATANLQQVAFDHHRRKPYATQRILHVVKQLETLVNFILNRHRLKVNTFRQNLPMLKSRLKNVFFLLFRWTIIVQIITFFFLKTSLFESVWLIWKCSWHYQIVYLLRR